MDKTALLLAAFIAGCSGGSNPPTPDDMAATADLASPPDLAVFQPTLPRLANHGGPVIAAMELWTVVFPGDETLGAHLDAFHRDMFGTSYYWTGILGQYGVGDGSARGVIVLPQAKPATLAHDAIPALLDGVAVPGGRNANTVLALVVPKTTMVTGVPAGEAAYHNETPKGPFIVLLQKDIGVGTAFDSLTFFASHEAAEVATDPYLNTKPAWFVDALGARFGEVADVCNPLDAEIYAVSDGGMPDNGLYVVARLWHEQAAEGGKIDPCWTYAKGVPWFDVAVDPEVVTAAAGASATVTLHPFAYGDVGAIDWEIDGAPAGVTAAPQTGTSNVGDAVPVTITLANPPSNDFVLAVVGTSQKTTYSSVWFFRVQVQ